MSGDTHDVMALSGLRRLVLHARDSLQASAVEPKWTYDSQAWKPHQVQSFAARQLAQHVLTLVADCLPADDGITADEAREIRREAAELNEALDGAVKQRNDLMVEREGLRSKLTDSESEVEVERDAYAALNDLIAERLGVDPVSTEYDEYERLLGELVAEHDRLEIEAAAQSRELVGPAPGGVKA